VGLIERTLNLINKCPTIGKSGNYICTTSRYNQCWWVLPYHKPFFYFFNFCSGGWIKIKMSHTSCS